MTQPAWVAQLPGFRPWAVAITRRKHSELAPDLIEDVFQQAVSEMWQMHGRGAAIANPRALLVAIMDRRATDLAREQAKRSRLAARTFVRESEDPELDELVAEGEHSRHRREALHEHLTAVELQAAFLCYGTDLSRPETAARLGIDERKLDRTLRKVAAKLTLIDMQLGARGGWCESIRPQVRAYALHELGEGSKDWEVAREHLDGGCLHCRTYVLELRDLAAVIPPLPAAAAAGHAGWLAHVPLLGRLLAGRSEQARNPMWSVAQRAEQLSSSEHARETLAGGGAVAAGAKIAAAAVVVTAVGVAVHAVPDVGSSHHTRHAAARAHVRPATGPHRLAPSFSPPILPSQARTTAAARHSASASHSSSTVASGSSVGSRSTPPPPSTGHTSSPVPAPQAAPSASAGTNGGAIAPQTAGGGSSAAGDQGVTLGTTPGPQAGP